MKQALLLVAHGSRREESNEEVRALTRRLADESGFDLVDCAFLELAQPDIVSGGRCLIERGASELTVVPYFLVAGRHVVTDVPGEIDKLRGAHPEVDIRITEHLGATGSMVGLILQRAGQKTP